MEKKSLLSANWLKAAFLLVALCFSGLYARAITTETLPLGTLVSGQTYEIPANTIATGVFAASLDGTVTLTSSVDANTNLVPFTDDTYETVITTERNVEARTKTFAITHNQPVYFKSVVSVTPYQVTIVYERDSNKEDYLDSIIPAEGEVNSLKEFTLTMTKKCYGMGQDMTAYLYKGDEMVAQTAISSFMNKNNVTFAFENEITEPGDYTLVIPEDSFQVGTSASGWNSEWRFNYTVVAPEPKMNVSIVGGATEAEAVTFNNLNGKVTFENTTATISDEWADLGIYGSLPGAPAGYGTWYVHYTVTKVSDTEYTLTPNVEELATLPANTAYQFRIPEGYFTYADGSKSPAYETWVKYEAPSFDPVTIAVTPAGGTEDAPVALSPEEVNFTLNITGAESIAISPAANNEDTCIYLQIWADYWEEYSNAVAYKPELVEGSTYRLVPFDEYWGDALNYLTAGKYRLYIPAGTFVFNGDDANVNDAVESFYTVVLPDMTVDPTPDTVVTQLDYVAICFNNESTVTASETVGATLKKDGEVVESDILGQVRWGVVRNTVSYWFATSHVAAGEYELVIPAEAITLGSGNAFEGASFKYTIKGEVSTEPTVVLNPAGGATEAEAVAITSFEITLTPENAEKITWFNGGWNTCFQVYDAAEQTWFNESYWVAVTENKDGSSVVKPDPTMGFVPVDGKQYRLYIPASEFYYDGDETKKNSEIISYYKFESLEPGMNIYPKSGTTVGVINNDTFTIKFADVESVVAIESSDIAITKDGYFFTFLKAEAVEGKANEFRLVDRGDNYSNTSPLPIKTAGNYGLYIPSGAFLVDGNYNETVWQEPYITVDGSLDYSPKMIVTPTEGTTVAKIDDDTFILEITGAQNVTWNPIFDTDPAARYIGVTLDGSYVHLLKPVAIEGESNKFRLVSCEDQSAVGAYMEFPIVTEGTYGLYIKDGAFVADGKNFPSTYYWNQSQVQVGSVAQMVVTPEDGATIESYKDIKISFEGVTTVEVNPSALNAEMGKVMLIPNEDWMNSAVAKPVAVEGETNVFTLEFIDGQLPESYKSLLFYMEEGTFFMDGADSPGIEYTYTVKSVGGEPAMIVTPEAGTTVKAITSDVITISFKNVKEVTISDAALNEASCKISIIDPKGNYIRTMPQAIEGETNMFRLVNFDGSDINLTAEGTYGLWIVGEFPQPAFYMDGTPCPSYYEANYLTVSSYSYTTEPAEGYVTSLKDVAITFNPGAQGMMKDAAGDVVLYKDGEEVEKVSVDNLSLLGWDPVLGMSLVVSFSKEYTENGEYKIVVPANVVELSGGIANKEITLNYTIGGVVSDWTAVADPAPGVVSELTTIYVTFEGATQIAVSPEAGPNDFPYYGTIAEDGTVTKVPYSIFSFAEGLNVVSLTIQNEESKLSEPGKYAIIIPATYCLVDGIAMTEDIRFDYTIEGAQPEYTIILNPADGATVNGEQLYEITVTFDGAKAIELNGDQATTLYQLDENGKPIANIYQNMSVEGNVAKFTVMELHKPYLDAAGTFQFTIPVGMVTITDNNDVVGKNKENIVATYYSNGVGVDTIGVDAKDLNIYTVNGMLIKRNGTYEDVKALEPGIYIINGKKFYVK